MKSEFYKILKNKLHEEITRSQLKNLEYQLDIIAKKLGIDIDFSKHFLDRANDPRNEYPIEIFELQELFKKFLNKHADKVEKYGADSQAVINDMMSDINIPFVIKWDSRNKEWDVINKTVMRKKNFRTSNPKLRV